MEDLTQISQYTLNLFGLNLVFNTETIVMTWIIMGILILFGIFATKAIGMVPRPVQVVGELFVDTFYGLTRDALEMNLVSFPFFGFHERVRQLFTKIELNWTQRQGLGKPSLDIHDPGNAFPR